jgi:hypothetical protein
MKRRTFAAFLLALVLPHHATTGDSDATDIRLGKTQYTRVIAKQRCTEYRGSQENQVERVVVNACVSSDAPGAGELLAFQQKFSHAAGPDPAEPNEKNGESSGVILEKQSVVAVRVPDLAQGGAYRTASFVTRTKVKDIRLQDLPEDTFIPPRGSIKVRAVPAPATPGQQPSGHDRNEFQVRGAGAVLPG